MRTYGLDMGFFNKKLFVILQTIKFNFSMKRRILTKLFIFFSFAIYSQNFTVNIQNLKEGDLTLIAMQSSDKFYKKWVKSSDTPNAASFNLSTGDWAIKIDATGYTYPSQKITYLLLQNQLKNL